MNKEKIATIKESLEKVDNPSRLTRWLGYYETCQEILGLIKKHTTTSIYIHSPDPYTNRKNIYGFLDWVVKQNILGKSTNLMLTEEWQSTVGYFSKLANSDRKRYFFYKGKLFWYEFDNEILRSSTLSYGSDMRLTITGLTRDLKYLREMAEEFMHKRKSDKAISYTWDAGKWNECGEIVPRPLKTVALKKSIKEEIIKEIELFLSRRDWYIENGIPYKLNILLEGPSGSGKTSLARAICTYFNFNLYCLNINNVTDITLPNALNSVIKQRSIVLVEDFEKAKAVKSRKGKQKTIVDAMNADKASETKTGHLVTTNTPSTAEEGLKEVLEEFSSLTMSGFLNAVDGAIPLDGVISIYSSNDISDVDTAVLRGGRIDLKYRIGELEDEDIKDFILDMTNIKISDAVMFKPIMGYNLSELFRKNCEDTSKFIDSIPGMKTMSCS